MKFKLEIDMENDAFQVAPGYELFLILDWVGRELLNGDASRPGPNVDLGALGALSWRLGDSNGNTVGHAKIVKEGRWVCQECGSKEVQESVWITMNDQVIQGGSPPVGNFYCPGCEDGEAHVRELPDPDEVEVEMHDDVRALDGEL